MKTALSFLLALSYFVALGQTNAWRVPSEWLSLSSTQLRPLPIDDGPESRETASEARTDVSDSVQATRIPQSDAQPAEAKTSFSVQQGASMSRTVDSALYRRLEAQGCFERKQPPPDNYFVRAVTTMWEPEVMHVGKTTVSCTIITAIKKKNPLCLLNPVVLSISW